MAGVAGRPAVVRGKGNSDRPRISLRPSDAESGGLLDDVNATVMVSEAMEYDYNGQSDPGPSLHIQLKADDGTEADQYYSAGKLDRIVPAEDGTGFEPAEGSSSKGLNSNSNAFVFLQTLVEKGFPEDKLDDLSALVGMNAHFNRVPQKQRAGLDSGEKKRTILVVTKINKLPWEAKGKSSAASGKSATPAKAATNGHGDLDAEAEAAVVEVLAANEGTFKGKTKLGRACFRSIDAKNPNRAKILKLVPTDDFLAAEGRPWAFDPEDESVTAV